MGGGKEGRLQPVGCGRGGDETGGLCLEGRRGDTLSLTSLLL